MQNMKHSCYLCGTVYPASVRFCAICLEQNTMLPVPCANEKIHYVRGDRKGIVSIASIREQELKGRHISNYNYLGLLPAVWRGLLYGGAGSGKSTYALNFAKAYKEKVLYVSAEEGVMSETIKRRIVANEITGDIYLTDSKLRWEIEEDFEKIKPALVIVDSVQALLDDALDLRLPCAQLWVCQVNKDKTFKGNSSLSHYVDIVLKMDEGNLHIEKNRYGHSGISISIWRCNDE